MSLRDEGYSRNASGDLKFNIYVYVYTSENVT